MQTVVLATASGFSMSLLTMTCRRMCRLILKDDALWRARLVGGSHLAVALRGRPLLRGVHRKYGLPEVPSTTSRDAFRYAYVCCKVASRVLRQEYVASCTLLKDMCIEADHVQEGGRHLKAWLKLERQLLEYPVGSSFDAVQHIKRLVGALPLVLESSQIVNHDTLATLRILGKTYQRNGRVPFDLIWELRRLERRLRHVTKLALFGHAIR